MKILKKELKIKSLIERLLYHVDSSDSDYLNLLSEVKEITENYPREIINEYNSLINIESIQSEINQ